MARMLDREGLKKAATRFGTPLYAYSEAVLERQCAALKKCFPGFKIQYAVKVNSNPELLRIIRKQGLGIETVSLGELLLARSAGFKPSETSFTCSNLSEKELVDVAAAGAQVHLDSLRQLELWGKNRLGSAAYLRVNQGIGKGAHKHWITGGPESKFGISLSDLDEAKKIAARYGVRVTGLHQHIGSNVRDVASFTAAAEALLRTASSFPDIEHIGFGGGFGVPYARDESSLDLQKVGKALCALARSFERSQGREVKFSIEPGRYVVAEAGTLLVSVVDDKRTESHRFIGVNSGFNHLVRPVMYGAHHEISNLEPRKGRAEPITIAGNLCESGDIFAWDRRMAPPLIGDVLAIQNAGSCGFAMASFFNLRKLPTEVLIRKDGALKKISFRPEEYAL